MTVKVGSKVRFKQGRGEFEGKVTDLADGIATVKRDSDGKEFSRRVDVLSPAKD